MIILLIYIIKNDMDIRFIILNLHREMNFNKTMDYMINYCKLRDASNSYSTRVFSGKLFFGVSCPFQHYITNNEIMEG